MLIFCQVLLPLFVTFLTVFLLLARAKTAKERSAATFLTAFGMIR
jgi:hypothetical protein